MNERLAQLEYRAGLEEMAARCHRLCEGSEMQALRLRGAVPLDKLRVRMTLPFLILLFRLSRFFYFSVFNERFRVMR